MAKFSRASSSSSTSTLSMEMEFLVAEDLDFVQVEEQGLSHWEFVNVSDADDSEKENSEKVESEEDKDERIGDVFGSLGFEKDETMVTTTTATTTTHHVDLDNDDDDHHHGHDYDAGLKFQGGNRRYGYGYGYDDVEENDDDEDDGEDDFDDELVPWDVSGKFGRQRMRKLGKRAFPKMYNSKKSPYLFVRPGCVRGKHGMGMKHNC